jgi:hypothetical protein
MEEKVIWFFVMFVVGVCKSSCPDPVIDQVYESDEIPGVTDPVLGCEGNPSSVSLSDLFFKHSIARMF